MKKEVLDKLTALAEMDLYPAVQQRSGEFFALVPSMIQADFHELASARAVPTGVFQVAAIFAAVETQGTQIVNEVNRISDQIRVHLASLEKCASTPKRMAEIGKSWRRQAGRVSEMIATAERLSNQPTWRGRASEAHLAVVPKQIAAMKELQRLAETASESVLVVGAIQSNIFDAVGLIFTQAMEQLRGHVSTAPAAFFSRSAGAVTLLTNVEALMRQWLSGEGTWSPSASQIADGLTETSSGGYSWPQAVKASLNGSKTDKDAETDKDGDWETTVSGEGVSVTGSPAGTDSDSRGTAEVGGDAADETETADEDAKDDADKDTSDKDDKADDKGDEKQDKKDKKDGGSSAGRDVSQGASITLGGGGETAGFESINFDKLVSALTPEPPVIGPPGNEPVVDTPPSEPVIEPPKSAPVVEQAEPTPPPVVDDRPIGLPTGETLPETTFDRDAVSYNPDDIVDRDIDRGLSAWDRLRSTQVER